MRLMFALLLCSFVLKTGHAQDFDHECPENYAFNFAGLKWYDVIEVHDGEHECDVSGSGHYFGYNDFLAIGEAGYDESSCSCNRTDPPVSVMIQRNSLKGMKREARLTDGLHRLASSLPTVDPTAGVPSGSLLDVIYDDVVIEVLIKWNGQEETVHFLCLCAFRTVSVSDASKPRVLGHIVRMAVPIADPGPEFNDGKGAILVDQDSGRMRLVFDCGIKLRNRDRPMVEIADIALPVSSFPVESLSPAPAVGPSPSATPPPQSR